jgi:hypothetical protein
LDEVSSTRDKEQFRLWKELMECSRDTLNQGRISGAENDPNRTPELPQLGDLAVRDLTMGNKSSFKPMKAGRALGVVSNC